MEMLLVLPKQLVSLCTLKLFEANKLSKQKGCFGAFLDVFISTIGQHNPPHLKNKAKQGDTTVSGFWGVGLFVCFWEGVGFFGCFVLFGV